MNIDELNKRLAEADSWDDLSDEEQKAVLEIKDHIVSRVNNNVVPVINKIAKRLNSALLPLIEWKDKHPRLYQSLVEDD